MERDKAANQSQRVFCALITFFATLRPCYAVLGHNIRYSGVLARGEEAALHEACPTVCEPILHAGHGTLGSEEGTADIIMTRQELKLAK